MGGKEPDKAVKSEAQVETARAALDGIIVARLAVAEVTAGVTLTPADVFAPEAVRKRASARRGLLHLTHRELSACWNSWLAMAAERRKAMELIRRSLRFLMHRKLARSFMSWLGAREASLPEPEPELEPESEPEPEPESTP